MSTDEKLELSNTVDELADWFQNAAFKAKDALSKD